LINSFELQSSHLKKTVIDGFKSKKFEVLYSKSSTNLVLIKVNSDHETPAKEFLDKLEKVI